MQLKMFLDEAAAATCANVPFDALRYTAGECNYGKSHMRAASSTMQRQQKHTPVAS